MNEDSLNFLNILANIATLEWINKGGDKRLKLLSRKFN
jgi:hypothetical protein